MTPLYDATCTKGGLSVVVTEASTGRIMATCESWSDAALIAASLSGMMAWRGMQDAVGRSFAAKPYPAALKYEHASDCAVHNEPAYPNAPCNCGAASR